MPINREQIDRERLYRASQCGNWNWRRFANAFDICTFGIFVTFALALGLVNKFDAVSAFNALIACISCNTRLSTSTWIIVANPSEWNSMQLIGNDFEWIIIGVVKSSELSDYNQSVYDSFMKLVLILLRPIKNDFITQNIRLFRQHKPFKSTLNVCEFAKDRNVKIGLPQWLMAIHLTHLA